MGLSLKELVELAMLDSVMDHAVTLERLMGSGHPWHELSGRPDVSTIMASSLSLFLERGLMTVAELHEDVPGEPLVGEEATLILHGVAANPELLTHIQVAVTKEGQTYYRQLAHRYYNG